jgi:fumarate reductase subunit C
MVQILLDALERAMKKSVAYTEYHPKWYRTRVSTYWWSRRWTYLKFILRELSSIFVAYFVLLLLLHLGALWKGEASYVGLQAWLRRPSVIALSGVSFLFVLFHTITWFNLAPKALPVRLGGKRVPDAVIAAPNYLVWLAVSAGIVWLVARG